MSVARWPLHAVLATPVAILACSISLIAAMVLSGLQAVFVRGPGPGSTIVGGAAFVALLWSGPARVTLRRVGAGATRTLLTVPVAGVVTVIAVTTLALILLLVAAESPTWWFPQSGPPWRVLR